MTEINGNIKNKFKNARDSIEVGLSWGLQQIGLCNLALYVTCTTYVVSFRNRSQCGHRDCIRVQMVVQVLLHFSMFLRLHF